MTPSPKNGFNYKITKFFVENSRLTILLLMLTIIIGLFTGLSLKTTGFPNPALNIIVVNTTYPGAASEKVATDITQPLEEKLKDVQGIDTFSSNSSNSSSSIMITVASDSNVDSVESKVDSAMKGVVLPTNATTPQVTIPEIKNPDFFISIADSDLSKVYTVASQIKNDVGQLPETSGVTAINELQQRVYVTVDSGKAANAGISMTNITNQLKTVGESMPVISNITLDGNNETLTTDVTGQTLTELQSISLIPDIAKTPTSSTLQKTTTPTTITSSYTLASIASISLKYEYAQQGSTDFSYNDGTSSQLLPAETLTISTAKGTNLPAFEKTIQSKLKAYQNATFVAYKQDIQNTNNKPLIIENYTINDSNQKQVSEVLGGLIGSKLSSNNPIIANLGWIFGGVELVFIAMLLFVSWRAAIVAALSIPLSLVFSMIYLYITGNDLNTIVLFSLVLAIGLVVDPALVILESIQRKIDSGLQGKDATLAAIRDVGNGLFMAALTNVIVFIPFGLISGVIGEIFFNIPLTMIPAIVGSYVVPLIFLSWIGGIFLKKKKGKTENEEKNLWMIAQKVIKINERVLYGSRWLRILIVIIAMILPFAIAAFYVGTGKVTLTQFSNSGSGQFVQVTGTFLPTVSQGERDRVTNQINYIIAKNTNVYEVFPISNGINYYIFLKPNVQNYTPQNLANTINTSLTNFQDDFLSLKAGSVGFTPSSGDYQVSLSITSQNLSVLKPAALDVAKNLLNVCKENTNYSISATCSNGTHIVTKVDDGYTNKEDPEIEITLDRTKLLEKQLTIPTTGIPLETLANETIKDLFEINNGKAVGAVKVNGTSTDIYVNQNTAIPETLQQIKDTQITATNGQKVKLSDIASIKQVASQTSIQSLKGQTLTVVQAKLSNAYSSNQAAIAGVTKAIVDYYNQNNGSRLSNLNLQQSSIATYSQGSSAGFAKSLSQLFMTLGLAIFLTYLVLVIFFESFTQPLVILFTIPLTFIGIFPALAYLGGGQIGFLEIIGIIILVGIVENVAIFLIDAARQKINNEGWEEKKAIAYASGVRFRPVILTKITAIASLAPLAVTSDTYKSLSLVIMFGLLTSGITSLFTTPILFIFFRWLSKQYRVLPWYHKILFFLFSIIYIVVLAIRDRKVK